MTSKNDRGFGMFNSSPRHDMVGKSDESMNSTTGGAKTPQYVITCKDFFDSDIEGMDEDSTPCLWIETGGGRLVTYDSSGELGGDGKIVNKDPVVCMKYGSWGPLIQQYMYTGKKLDLITVTRLTSIEQTIVPIQRLEYATCLIKTYEQYGDTVTFSFCYIEITDTNIAYNHNTGEKLGQTAMKFNMGSLKVELNEG
ncbi:MAG: hypothetical protein LBO02_02230 [Holosporaceae bacterium]|jgi:hypothetical protein|nr:hypothetical protein [Holosporaceae bacterium]